MRYLRLMFLFGQLARLTLLDTNPAGGEAGGTGGSGGGSGGSGGAGGTGGAGAEGAAGGGQGGAGGAATGGQGGSQPAGGAGGSGGNGQPQNVTDLPEWAQRTIREARQEAATNRVGRTTAEQARTDALKALAATLGVDVTAGAPTVEQVQGQLTTVTAERDTARQQARTAQVQVAALPVAAKYGADPVALMDSASFLAKLGQLDPAGEKFGEQLDAAVKAAVDGNPRLKAGQAPGRGGFDPAGGTGGSGPAASLEDAFGRHYAAKT